MKRTAMGILAVALLALGAAGCGERDQSTQYRDGKYRGKSDTRPWDNAPAATSPGAWTKGDRESWDSEMRARAESSQNENRRIGH